MTRSPSPEVSTAPSPQPVISQLSTASPLSSDPIVQSEPLVPIQSLLTTIPIPVENTTDSPTLSSGSQPQQTQEVQSDTNQPSSPSILKQQSRLATLSSQLAQLTEELTQARTSLRNADASATITRHIKLLHEYNDVRDAGLKLMEIVAERRGVRLAEVMAEVGVGDED